ncbi:MAG TPA: hypothetical protein VKQ32_20765 [Polyangia bacterium]|nr:hypothetical protein [Polyangia bacterium]
MIGGRWRGVPFASMALGLLFVLFAARAMLMPASGDTYWHLRAGADIVRTGAVPHVETYSFTAAGHPWREHEWLWDPISYTLYRLGGMPLLTLFGAALAVATLVLIHRLMIGPAWIRMPLLMLLLVFVGPLWVLRPQLFTFLAVPLLMTLLARERFWPIPALFVVWANMHGAVALGGIVLGAATAAALLRWRVRRTPGDRRRALALAVVLPASALACLATPQGAGMFHFLADSMVRIHAVGIGEWQRPSPKDPYGAIFFIVVLGLAVLLVVRRRALRAGGHASSWTDWAMVAGAVALVPLAMTAVRNVGVFALVAIPAASRLLGPDVAVRLPWRKAREPGPDGDRPVANLIVLGVAALGALAFVGWSYRSRAPMLGWQPIDARAIQALRACDGPLYNQYDEGGYLIWFVPEKPVFVDNRQDPYPIEHIRAQLDVQWGAASYRPLFERWGIRCAFLPLTSTTTVAALGRDGWVTRYRDDTYMVLSAPARPSR